MYNNSMLLRPEFEKAKNYWIDKLSGMLCEMKLAADYIKGTGYKEANCKFIMDKKLSGELYRIGKSQDIALFTILTAALKILVYKYTNQNDTLVGSPVYTNSESTYEYNKYIILRDFIDSEMTFKEFLMKVKKTVKEGYENQHYPFYKLAEFLKLEDGLSPFRIGAIMENIHNQEVIEEVGTSFGSDVIFSFLNTGESLDITILYNANLYKEESIAKLQACYLNILNQVLSDTGIKIADIELITEDERHKINEVFNNTKAPYPEDKTLQRMFEEQAELTPDNVAVSCVIDSDDGYFCKELTYRELNEKANQLAHVLRQKGIGPNSIVAFMPERSIEMVIGILGILKSGGAYLPIDPDYPQDRIGFLLEDSGTGVLLTHKRLIDKVKFKGEIIYIDDEATYTEDISNIREVSKPQDLAYVIYTSGSTGKPKGVLIENRSVVNFAHWRIKKYGYRENDVTLQLISVSFDGFGTNFYSSLLSGSSLIIVGEKSWMDFGFIRRVIRDRKVTNMSVVPSMYKAILGGAKREDLITLRFVVLAGEKSGESMLDLSRTIIPETVLINEYGPTENTITTTSFTGLSRDRISVIGQPAANQRVYIVNKDLNLMPIGVPGELCISGTGLARGYFRRPELTAEKFITNPFNSYEGEDTDYARIYKTGDFARWLEDGNIEFLARVDHQIKIRGFRIELGEIENALASYEPVKECSVIVSEDTNENKHICAYIVSDQELTTEQLREHLSETLPDYMIPSYFVKLDKIPLTPNGKVNRNALTEHKVNISTGVEHMAPRNSNEEKLLKIWQKVLGVNSIGINDRFFDIGGDSMKAVSVSEECEKQGMKISANLIFTYRTISKIVENTDGDKKDISASDNSGDSMHGTDGKNLNVIEDKPEVKKLKVKPQREVTTYLHRSLPLCAILAHDQYHQWFYQHYIQIFAITYQNGFSRLEFLEPKNNFEDIFDETYLTYEGVKDEADIVGFIKGRIDMGCYISIYIDEYYLPQKSNYKKNHFVHPSLIYGYDNSTRKLLAIGFDSEMIFGEITFDYDIFDLAYEGAKFHYKETAPWAETEAIQLLMPKELDNACQFDLKVFLEELDNYLTSSGTNGTRIDKLIAQDEKNMCSEIIYGIDIHHVINNALEKLSMDILKGLDVQNIIEQCMEKNVADIMPTMDYRSMHLLYEHKQCLYERIKFIARRYKVSGNLLMLLEQYQKLIQKLNSARLIFFDLEHMFKAGFGNQDTDMGQIMGSFKQMMEIMATIRDEEQALLGDIYKEIVLLN